MSVARLALGWSGLPTPAPGSSGLPVIMVPATAVGLILGGIGLLLLSGGRSGSSRLRLLAGRLAALAAAALGLVVLGQYLIDMRAAGGRGTLVPGAGPWALRPSPNTALALAFVGGALLAHSAQSGRVRPWAGRAAAAALLVTLTALIGHAYGATTLYGFTRSGGMALSTAFALSALAVGVLFADPERGIAAVVVSDSAGGRLLRRLVPVAILIPPLLGWLRVAAQRAGLVDTAFGSALLVVSLVVVFVGFLGYSLMIAVFTPMILRNDNGMLAASSGLSQRSLVLGVLLALYPLGQFLGSPVLGTLSDRFGRRPVLIASLIATTALYGGYRDGARDSKPGSVDGGLLPGGPFRGQHRDRAGGDRGHGAAGRAQPPVRVHLPEREPRLCRRAASRRKAG